MSANVGPRVKGLKGLVHEYVGRGRERIDREGGRIEAYADQEPARALLLALGFGVLLGLLIKRH